MGSAVGTLAGAALGSFIPGVGTALGASLGGAAGGLLGGSGGGGGGGAYSTAAGKQQAAGLAAAQAAAFRPVGVTTRFGTSQFTTQTDPRTGLPIVTGAQYTATPELKALQDRLSALYGTSLGFAEQAPGAIAPLAPAAQGLFGLGQQYLAQTPEQARQQYMTEQMALLDPIRAREEARLASSVFGRGRAGLNIGDIGQPELFSLASARRQQDLQLAAQAEQAAQQRIGFGAGLFGTGAGLLGQQYATQTAALAPFQQQFGVQQALEQAALQPLEIGAQLGGRNVNTTGATALLYSGLAGAKTGLEGSLQQQSSGQLLLNKFIDQLGGQKGLTEIGGKVGSWVGGLGGGLFSTGGAGRATTPGWGGFTGSDYFEPASPFGGYDYNYMM